MDFQLVFAIALFFFAIWLAWQRQQTRKRSAAKIAERLGLSSRNEELFGEVDGRRIETHRLSRGRGRYKRWWTAFDLQLHTAPPGLQLATEGVVSKLSKLVGVHDVQVGDPAFDGEFLIRCENEAAAKAWLTVERRKALLHLHQFVDEVSVVDGHLLFDLPADPYAEEELAKAVRYGLAIANHVDDPANAPLPARIELRDQRAKRSKWRPLGIAFMLFFPLIMMGLGAAYLFYTLVPSEEELAKRRVTNVAIGTTLKRCLEELPRSWDIDLDKCKEAADGAEPFQRNAREPLTLYHQLRARKASRVQLEPATATDAITAMQEVVREEDEMLVAAWENGLFELYARYEDWSSPASLEAAHSYALVDDKQRVPIAPRRRGNVSAIALECLTETLTDGSARGTRAHEVARACLGVAGDEPSVDGAFGRLSDDRSYVAALEPDPETHLEKAVWRVQRDVRDYPKTALYVMALQLANGDTEAAGESMTKVSEHAAPFVCGGAWSIGQSFGDPAIWRKAAPKADPLDSLMRTHAAVQAWYTGDVDGATAAPPELDDPLEVTCIAQIRIAAGDHEGALELLDRATVPDALAPLEAYTRSQAHFVAGEWDEAAKLAATAAEGFSTSWFDKDLRNRAALFAIAAQSHAGVPEVGETLTKLFGEAPAFDELGDDPAMIALWFAAAVNNEDDDPIDRWVAPANLGLVPGAEIAELYLAGRLASDGNVEYWLDVMTPKQFNPFSYVDGRRVAAELRGDAEAAAQWSERRDRLTELMTSPSAARLRHIAYPVPAAEAPRQWTDSKPVEVAPGQIRYTKARSAGLVSSRKFRKVAEAHRAEVKYCFDKGPAGESLEAKANIDISTMGSTSAVTVEMTPDVPQVRKCLERKLDLWRYPAASIDKTGRATLVMVGQSSGE